MERKNRNRNRPVKMNAIHAPYRTEAQPSSGTDTGVPLDSSLLSVHSSIRNRGGTSILGTGLAVLPRYPAILAPRYPVSGCQPLVCRILLQYTFILYTYIRPYIHAYMHTY